MIEAIRASAASRAQTGPQQCAPVLVFEKEPLVREALTVELEHAGFPLLVCATANELKRALSTSHPAAFVIDLTGETDGVWSATMHAVWTRCPGICAIVLAGGNRDVVDPDEADGPVCVLSRATASSKDVTAALEAFGVPQTRQRTERDVLFERLTPREREVLHYVGLGHDNLKIAAWLGISERTVRAHTAALYRKLDAENRAQLVVIAFAHGMCRTR